MITDRMALSRATTDRDAERRERPGLLAELVRDPSTRLLLVDARGRVALGGHGTGRFAEASETGQSSRAPGTAERRARETGWGTGSPHPADHLPRIRAADLEERDLEGLTTAYLGREPDGTGEACGREPGGSWLAVVVPTELEVPEAPAAPGGGRDAEGAGTERPGLRRLLEEHPLTPLRAVGAQMSAHDAGLATAACALAAWHASSTYCPCCGAATLMVQAGWARRCTVCAAVHFPRTDPSVIMTVTDADDRLVMVHGATWPPGRFSVVAGYVEAGESLEAAVVREVAEETGLRVEAGSVGYLASQPWPFPRSLMVGYRARLEPGPLSPRPDGQEVTEVMLVSRQELARAVADGSIVLPGPTSIGRLLIEDWYGGPIPG